MKPREVNDEVTAQLIKQILKEQGFAELQKWLIKRALKGSSWDAASLEDGGELNTELKALGLW